MAERPTKGRRTTHMQEIKTRFDATGAHSLRAMGLSNVFLLDGVTQKEGQPAAYRDAERLFHLIAGAIARRSSPLTGGELRFLRKRLGMTQPQFGAIVGKGLETVRQWERGRRKPPVAEGCLLRLQWLERHDRAALAAAVHALQYAPRDLEGRPYVFRFAEGEGWVRCFDC